MPGKGNIMPVDKEELEIPLESEVNQEEEILEEELPEFDPQYAKDFDGLNYLGALTSQFEWLGHKFVIRTLTIDEYLAVATLTKDYQETIGVTRAYETAIAALCVETIDGKSLPTPVQEETLGYAWAYQCFNFVKGRWYTYTIKKIYEEYLQLEARAEEVIESMGNASGWTESQTLGLNANSV